MFYVHRWFFDCFYQDFCVIFDILSLWITVLNSLFFYSLFGVSDLTWQVPGNFHVSTHSAETQPDNPDMTHIIHKVRFGMDLQEGKVRSHK